MLFTRGTIKVFKTCHSSLITFKLQPFFDNKYLKWFAILTMSWSRNSLIFSVGQVYVSSGEAIFSKTGDWLRSSNLDSMLPEIETMALR